MVLHSLIQPDQNRAPSTNNIVLQSITNTLFSFTISVKKCTRFFFGILLLIVFREVFPSCRFLQLTQNSCNLEIHS